MGRLLTAQQVADMTSLSVETFYSWRSSKRAGVPHGFKLGGRVVYDEDEITEWIAQQQAASRSPVGGLSGLGVDPANPVAGSTPPNPSK